MKFSLDKEEKYTILSLQEEKLDTTIAPNLKSEFVTLNAEGVKNLILDLSNVKYTDSSGLSAILVGNRLFKEVEGAFILTRLNEHVFKLIKISQLQNVLDVMPTVEEAVDLVYLSEIEKDLKTEDDDTNSES